MEKKRINYNKNQRAVTEVSLKSLLKTSLPSLVPDPSDFEPSAGFTI